MIRWIRGGKRGRRKMSIAGERSRTRLSGSSSSCCSSSSMVTMMLMMMPVVMVVTMLMMMMRLTVIGRHGDGGSRNRILMMMIAVAHVGRRRRDRSIRLFGDHHRRRLLLLLLLLLESWCSHVRVCHRRRRRRCRDCLGQRFVPHFFHGERRQSNKGAFHRSRTVPTVRRPRWCDSQTRCRCLGCRCRRLGPLGTATMSAATATTTIVTL